MGWKMGATALLVFFTVTGFVESADLVVQTPFEIDVQSARFRLDYRPAEGYPAPNATFTPAQIRRGVTLTNVLPGAKYEVSLYLTNDSYTDWPAWSETLDTKPNPPENFSASVLSGKIVQVSWLPPTAGGTTGYKLKVIPYSEPQNSVHNIIIDKDKSPFTLRELTPGASYGLELYSRYGDAESSEAASANITTIPNTPGRFIVWFRNETTMLVLWQPPYPAGIYSKYKVSIDPPDAPDSVFEVEKDGEPPGPAQAAFYGLTPGRPYNISVQTISNDQVSLPTTAQYRTVPLAPRNVTFDPRSLKPRSFVVRWQPPKGFVEFDKYSVSIDTRKKAPQIIERGQPTSALFTEGLEPGVTYKVMVKAVSVNVASWPAEGNVTTSPLPVIGMNSTTNPETGEIFVEWQPDPESYQDHYRVTYQELETFNGDSSTTVVGDTKFSVDNLLPGRNYSISVAAVSNSVPSVEVAIFQATKPATPIIENLEPIPEGLNISWKSDVTSRQDHYAVIYTRNDTEVEKTVQTELPRVQLRDLYPGAVYEIRIFAISHNLWSNPHKYYQAVFPNEVRDLNVTVVSASSVRLDWNPPRDSIYDGYIVRYTTADGRKTELPLTTNTSYMVRGLLPGYRYTLQVSAVSSKVESWKPVSVQQTLPPAKTHAGDVQVLIDSSNVTLIWQVPDGYVDNYIVSWWPIDDPAKKETITVGETLQAGKMAVPVTGLRPGEQYLFEIYSTAHEQESEKITINERTLPLFQSTVQLVSGVSEPSTLTITYTPTPPSGTTFDRYRCVLADADKPGQPIVRKEERMADDPNRSCIFKELVPGRVYRVTMWTVSGGVTSVPYSRDIRLYPAPITEINATRITDTEMTLTWDEPNGEWDGFDVYHQGEGEASVKNMVVNPPFTFQDLTPHKNYTFTIRTLSGSQTRLMQRSDPLSASFVTDESVPGRVAVFTAADLTPNQIRFRWRLPDTAQNGVLQGFTIRYGEKDAKRVLVQDFGPHETEGLIRDLQPGQAYTFQIQARTKPGYGPVTNYETTMPVWPPPEPNARVFPTEVSKNDTTIRVRFRKNYFSDENGPVIGYSIVVAEDYSKDSSGFELPNWLDVQAYPVWPPYQVNRPYNPFSNRSVEDFTIGTDAACAQKCPRERCYCNGPLKSGTNYVVKVRAYTAPDKFADTAYSHPIQTDYTKNYTNVLVAIFVPLLVLALIAVVIVIMRRRNMAPFYMTKEMRHKDDDMSLRDSIIETSRPVKLKDFLEHYRFMSADSDIRFSEEYEDLKQVGRDQPCTFADLPCNRPKNRFTNILPYDHSRVKLQPTDDEEGSDYINANYVPGYTSPREFIVTQGPLHSTRDDFWRMVWESNSRAIVMLTRCVEKGREKCDHYWPYDMQPQYYGEIQVVVLNQSQFPDWTVSEFKVMRGDSSRVVRHFHFTTWPDFGVPEPAQVLVRFVRAFRERVPYDQKPIITHCSAGVGRSGTFIALDRAIQHIRKYDYIDIFGMVYDMRKERVLMVQTEVQYICIHTCLKVVLEGKENDDLSMRETHTNMAYDDDEGIAESGM
ncbi:Tyrosine-protein phosphatase 10D [Amphibalanus amphitrite]|uniref:protein-tyrosine-phosphatase n=1 Tax=Amphibalanus amphitrite TaxID=1232801 RepID=A0A6A4VK44_AMPAM|nr:Tyrosine-protein phosphatase 10D [Amphibalanus amphitrite]